MLKELYSIYIYIITLPFRLLKLKKRSIVFTGLTGGDAYEYSGNLRYFCEYLKIERPGRYKSAFIVDEPKRYADVTGVDFYRHYSMKAFRVMLTSGIIVTSGSYAPWFRFRKRQCVINTWHGGGAYKKISMGSTTLQAHRRRALINKNVTAFMSSCRAASRKLIRGEFGFEGDIIEAGLPRNDLLVRYYKACESGDVLALRQAENIISADVSLVRERYQIEKTEKILLYAPTYRNYDGNVSFEELDLSALKRYLERDGQRWKILIRYHRYHSYICPEDDMTDVSDYQDMQKLLASADILITDYSSSIWDYSFLLRPCFLYVPDLKNYLSDPGFYTAIKRWPFPAVRNMEELYDAIARMDFDKLSEAIHTHFRYMGCYESGNACRALERYIRQESY